MLTELVLYVISSHIVFEATSATCNFVRWFSPRHLLAFHSNFTWLLLQTIKGAEREMVEIDLFSRSQGWNVHIILGFVHYSISYIAYIPCRFSMIVALDQIHLGKRHSWCWPIFKVTGVKLFTACNFVQLILLQSICRHSIQILLDCCLEPPRVQKGRWLTLTYFRGHRGQKRDTVWNFTTHVGATCEFVHKPGIIFLIDDMTLFLILSRHSLL